MKNSFSNEKPSSQQQNHQSSGHQLEFHENYKNVCAQQHLQIGNIYQNKTNLNELNNRSQFNLS